jgi:hypothetical protein
MYDIKLNKERDVCCIFFETNAVEEASTAGFIYVREDLKLDG